VLEDPALQRLVTERGWAEVCRASVTDTTWRAQFRDAYTALQRAREAAVARHAAGLPGPPPRTALPSGPRPMAEPGDPGAPVLSVGQALARMREQLDAPEDLDVDLSEDSPAIPSSPAERRARAARARRRVEEAKARWAREEMDRERA